MIQHDKPTILFDGVCNLCNGFVQFIIIRDKKRYFRFASLQSDFVSSLNLDEENLISDMNTVILLEDGHIYTKSAAVLRIVRQLRFPYPLAYIFVVIPRPVRDILYSWISRNRYRWFGKRESCMIPTPDLVDRFIT
jgi:predicted DCC family thiol-disulfide oxidoreductase YuxK